MTFKVKNSSLLLESSSWLLAVEPSVCEGEDHDCFRLYSFSLVVQQVRPDRPVWRLRLPVCQLVG